jgi:hypothetical protein
MIVLRILVALASFAAGAFLFVLTVFAAWFLLASPGAIDLNATISFLAVLAFAWGAILLALMWACPEPQTQQEKSHG